MEKSVIAHTDIYLSKFKTDIQKKAIDLSFDEREKLNELLEFMFEYEKINFDVIFTKKAAKPAAEKPSPPTPIVFPDEERCIANRKQGDRCTRKRTKGQLYCGTHCVKPPTDPIPPTQKSSEKPPSTKTSTIEVVAHEIQGIIYYIDNELNVYNTEDIFKNINKPRIIAKAVQLSQNVFSIPSLGL